MVSDSPKRPVRAPRHADAPPRISRDQLQQVARRQLAASTERARQETLRVSPRRVALWVIEALVLLALLEAFVLRPAMVRRNQHRLAATDLPPAPPEAVPPLGARALPLKGLREAEPVLLAPLDRLAEGSGTMRSAQRSFSADTRLPIEVVNSIGMRFRLVPPGTALIGSPDTEAGRGDREQQHVFAAREPFYLGTYEVTQAVWERVCSDNPSHFKGAERPVEEVSWYDCQRFLAELCLREEVPAGTYRLPTEAEWEYACRAGTTTAYCCGDDARQLHAFATHGETGQGATVAVGEKRPNGLGLYDMHGNVWEWCQDRFAPYPNDPQPVDPEHTEWRCLRGGNWYVPPVDCRSAGRNRLPPASHGNMLGFRVLRTVSVDVMTAEPAEERQNPR